MVSNGRTGAEFTWAPCIWDVGPVQSDSIVIVVVVRIGSFMKQATVLGLNMVLYRLEVHHY